MAFIVLAGCKKVQEEPEIELSQVWIESFENADNIILTKDTIHVFIPLLANLDDDNLTTAEAIDNDLIISAHREPIGVGWIYDFLAIAHVFIPLEKMNPKADLEVHVSFLLGRIYEVVNGPGVTTSSTWSYSYGSVLTLVRNGIAYRIPEYKGGLNLANQTLIFDLPEEGEQNKEATCRIASIGEDSEFTLEANPSSFNDGLIIETRAFHKIPSRQNNFGCIGLEEAALDWIKVYRK